MESKYQIEGILGEGAMAVVYRARHRELGSLHAIKKLKNQDPTIKERLIQEGRMQASFKHPNVLAVTDLVVMDGCPALVMEYVKGPSLDEFLHKHRPSMTQCDALARDILKGVAAAHAHGMVHRDLKPSNILVAVTEDSLIPKIADFGLAKVLDEAKQGQQLTETGITMGTPAYMAPEQINNFSEVDERADVFSLGAILYELMTGEMCFNAPNFMGIWDLIQKGEFSPPKDLVPDLPQRMSTAISDALIVEKERRIPDVSGLFRRWCTDETGEHVPVDGNQKLDFWSAELRNKISALVPHEIDPCVSAEHMISDVNTIAFGAADTLSLSDGVVDRSLATQGPISMQRNGVSIWGSVAISVVTVSLLIFALSWFGFSNNPLGSEGGNANSLGNPSGGNNPPMKHFYNPNPDDETDKSDASIRSENVFGLGSQVSSALKKDANDIVDFILKGNYWAAKKRITDHLAKDPTHPTLNALRIIIHGLQGEESLASRQAFLAANWDNNADLPINKMLHLSHQGLNSKTNESYLQSWAKLMADNDYPIAHLLHAVSTKKTSNQTKHLELIRNIRQKHPKWVPLYTLEHNALAELGQLKMMVQVAEMGLGQRPGNSRLLSEKASSQLKLGQLDSAEVNFNQALKQDEHLIEAYIGLAEITYKREVVLKIKLEEDDLSHNSYFIKANADSLDSAGKFKFLQDYARLHFNHGQKAEGNKLLDYCIKMAIKEEDNENALTCLSTGLDALYWITPSSEWSVYMNKMRELVSLEKSKQIQTKYFGHRLKLADAQLAIDQNRKEEAELLIKDLPKEEVEFDTKNSHISPILEIKIALALTEKNVSKSLNLIEAERQFDPSAINSCRSYFHQARVFEFQQQKTDQIQVLKTIVNGECRDNGDRGLIEANSHLMLAEMYLKQRDKPKAREQLSAFNKKWEDADPNLVAVQLAKKLSKQIK